MKRGTDTRKYERSKNNKNLMTNGSEDTGHSILLTCGKFSNINRQGESSASGYTTQVSLEIFLFPF